MKHEFPSAKATELLDTLFQRMQDCGCYSIPAVSDDRLAGLMTMDNLRELLLTRHCEDAAPYQYS